MQFLRTPRDKELATPSAGHHVAYTELSMYKDHPTGDLSLEEFEKFALDRLRILKAIEEAKLRSKPDQTIQEDVKLLISKHLKETTLAETIRKDTISHYILRLAYCRTADLRSWLLQQESTLFKYRFRELSSPEQVEFFRSVGLPYAPLPDADVDAIRDQLAAVEAAHGNLDGRNELRRGDTKTIFQVPFTAVPDLIATRKVLLKGGFAYVGREQVYSLVVGTFRQQLSAALTDMSKRWGTFACQEGARLAPLVEAMPSRSLSSTDNRKVPHGDITAGQLPAIAANRHLPLCMAVMYERTTTEHHIKHWGFQQLSLFLKSIGLPLEQAMLFWRHSFAPRTPTDKFNREYAYNVRYAYGQEGNRKDWSEWGCVKIISTEVGPASVNMCECNGGCPYKTFDEPRLRAALTKLRCNDKLMNDSIDKAKGRHYQIACALAFEGVTGVPHDTGINKPSEYYAASIEVAQQREAQGEQAAAAAAAMKGVASAAGDAAVSVAAAATPGPSSSRERGGTGGVPPTPATAGPSGHRHSNGATAAGMDVDMQTPAPAGGGGARHSGGIFATPRPAGATSTT
eukprot:jgi/Chrzof1/2434/Cz11g15130.t1